MADGRKGRLTGQPPAVVAVDVNHNGGEEEGGVQPRGEREGGLWVVWVTGL